MLCHPGGRGVDEGEARPVSRRAAEAGRTQPAVARPRGHDETEGPEAVRREPPHPVRAELRRHRRLDQRDRVADRHRGRRTRPHHRQPARQEAERKYFTYFLVIIIIILVTISQVLHVF